MLPPGTRRRPIDQDFDRFLQFDRRATVSAFVRGDASLVDALPVQTGQATFFDPGGGLTEGAEAVNEANAEGSARFGPEGTTELDYGDKAPSGDLVFWTGFQTAEVDVGGGMKPMNIRVTEVFCRVDGEWKMIHRHASMAGKEGAGG